MRYDEVLQIRAVSEIDFNFLAKFGKCETHYLILKSSRFLVGQ